mmetsp:Transcript_17290/g.51885  ORF Transcript_17290/g.51885 Transcript_17290/m.51885 type:complete len:346 (-) Transcript_17290:1232-2269(-)
MRFVSMKSSRASKLGALTSKVSFSSPSFLRKSEMFPPTFFSHESRSMNFSSLNVCVSLIIAWRGRPWSAMIILFVSKIARTSMLSLFTSAIAGSAVLRSMRLPWNLASWRISSEPTFPVPMMPTAMVVSESVKPSWAARRARPSSSRSTTAEMLRSEEPCAMAMTFTLARPRALKKLPATPPRFFMPSPMTARMLTLSRLVTRISESRLSSTPKACSTPARALSAWLSSTATVIECSEEPCDVRMTFTPALPRASIILRATPGVPRKDAPASVTSATFSMEVMAVTGICGLTSSGAWSSQRNCSSPRPYTFVPGCEGLKTLRTRTGMRFSMHGTMAEGWSTWPPK